MTPNTSHIPFEDVARYPLPGMAYPIKFSFTPDGKSVVFLDSVEGSLVRQMFAFDPATGARRRYISPPGEGATEDNLSLEEKLRRERMRQLDLGVTDYAWSSKGSLLIPMPDGLYIRENEDSELRKLLSNEGGPLLDPRFSPDGAWVAYVQDDELCVVEVATGQTRQVTTGARGTGKTHGLAEYIAQEEMHRTQGYWWSPDSKWLAFEEADETHIPIYRIIHQGKDAVGEGAQEDHRYPFAGHPNAKVRLGAAPRDGGDTVWMDLGQNEDIYLARAGWIPDGSLVAQVENREQTVLDLLRFDPRTGKPTPLLQETSDVWVNLHDLFKPLKDGSFLWASERSGFMHLYRYDAQGKQIAQLTSGDWMVLGLSGIDETKGLVYFTATKESPLEVHLYSVPLSGGDVRKITTEPGTHTVALDKTCTRFVDTCDSLAHPARVTLRSLEDDYEIAVIHEPNDPRTAQLGLEPPEMVTLKNRDGETLYGAIYRPVGGSAPYPTIVSVYGGPHAQMVANTWKMAAAMRAQALRRMGFLVFVLDNRGAARRGLAFEGAIKHCMGGPEVDDQVDGVRWLVDQGLADPARVGIYGWSYGGYMSAMCLARAPETFACAVAGAPVTAWDGYDTHYTERYMGTPQSNTDGYAQGSVMAHVGTMTGRLMLVHGLIDENVHFRHTARLINALIAARKTYDLLLFPDERHSPRRLGDRVFMEEQIAAFFERNLKR